MDAVELPNPALSAPPALDAALPGAEAEGPRLTRAAAFLTAVLVSGLLVLSFWKEDRRPRPAPLGPAGLSLLRQERFIAHVVGGDSEWGWAAWVRNAGDAPAFFRLSYRLLDRQGRTLALSETSAYVAPGRPATMALKLPEASRRAVGATPLRLRPTSMRVAVEGWISPNCLLRRRLT